MKGKKNRRKKNKERRIQVILLHDKNQKQIETICDIKTCSVQLMRLCHPNAKKARALRVKKIMSNIMLKVNEYCKHLPKETVDNFTSDH